MIKTQNNVTSRTHSVEQKALQSFYYSLNSFSSPLPLTFYIQYLQYIVTLITLYLRNDVKFWKREDEQDLRKLS